MNAHHKKRTYQPTLPKDLLYISSGRLDLSTPTPTTTTTTTTPSQPSHSPAKITKNKLETIISSRPFGSQLTAIIPSTSIPQSLPIELQETISLSTQFRYCPNVNLGELLQPEFLNAYIRQGSLIGLSLGEEEGDDVVSIDGRGRLFLAVCKDTYELLGLTGRPSAYGSLGQRYIIEIDLKSPSFKAGKPGFEQIKSKLSNWPTILNLFNEIGGSTPNHSGRTFEMVFSFVDDSGSSKDITFPPSLPSSLRRPSVQTKTLSLKIPSISTWIFGPPPLPLPPNVNQKRKKLPFGSTVSDAREEWEDQTKEIREWCGLVALGEDPFESREEERDEKELVYEEGVVKILSWEGFFHPQTLFSLLKSTFSPLLSPSTSSPFLSLSLLPPRNSPLSHLSAKPTTRPGRKRPEGKRVRRGKGRGEEEENGSGGEVCWGILLVEERGGEGDGGVRWCGWEGRT